MRKTLSIILFITSLLFLAQFCTNKLAPELRPLSDDPIATVGHGSFLNKEGKQIQLTEAFIKQVQELYIRKLSDAKLPVRDSSIFSEQKIQSTKALIYSTVKNDVLANALYIEWLIAQRKPVDEAQFSTVNNSLRWYYVLNIQKNPVLPDKDKKWSKGIPDEEAKKLEGNGIIVYAITNAGMQAYCQECLEAGVPVPPNMFGDGWTNLGEVDNEFISQTSTAFPGVELRAELMIYVSNDPEGFCLALPRYLVRGSQDEAELFGVICLGTRTSKACFFDNPNGNFFRKNNVIDFRSNFVGGADLILNNQGTCSDCHAGENPYIVHPAKRPFQRIVGDGHVPSIFPARWYDPIVPGTWPQNPGPTHIMDAITSTGQCNSCHEQGRSGGRLPDLSFPLWGYCNQVLRSAVRRIADGGTMPHGIGSLPATEQDSIQALYAPHINALTSYCGLTREDGKLEIANIPQDPSFISPPMVIGPLYACATKVAVRGAVLNAKVTLYINGPGGSREFTIDSARNPIQLDFNVSPALLAGDVVTVTQEHEGAISDPGETAVTVRNYRDAYPAGLPKPAIDPDIVYACADLIAVRHMPGATVTVYTNGANPRSFATSTGWTAIPPAGAPFRESDAFTVQLSMCGDSSLVSDAVSARRPPMRLAPPTFNPPAIFNGQELLNIETIEYGAKVTLRETSGSGWSGSFSTPVTWFPNYDIRSAMGRPLQASDNLQAMQSLCATASEWTPVEKMQDCERLPAPQIERPIAGNKFVIVARAVPGARIMVYDAAGNEIGDGSGTVIRLRRAIAAGETLSVVQRVGQCSSRFVYRVRASSGQ